MYCGVCMQENMYVKPAANDLWACVRAQQLQLGACHPHRRKVAGLPEVNIRTFYDSLESKYQNNLYAEGNYYHGLGQILLL